ncbi:hypothetical protein NL500_30870, partial [Klebsiella pneumoniae]|nr:hypothetical protein [Klebsiella pneumoniae]
EQEKEFPRRAAVIQTFFLFPRDDEFAFLQFLLTRRHYSSERIFQQMISSNMKSGNENRQSG